MARFHGPYVRYMEDMERRRENGVAAKDYASLEALTTRDLGLVFVVKFVPIDAARRHLDRYEDRPPSKETWVVQSESLLRCICEDVRTAVPEDTAIWHRISPTSPHDDITLPLIRARTGTIPEGPLFWDPPPIHPPEAMEGWTPWQHPLDVVLSAFCRSSDLNMWAPIRARRAEDEMRSKMENLSMRTQKKKKTVRKANHKDVKDMTLKPQKKSGETAADMGFLIPVEHGRPFRLVRPWDRKRQ